MLLITMRAFTAHYLRAKKYLRVTLHALLIFLVMPQAILSAESASAHIPLPKMILMPGAKIEIGSLLDYRAQPIHTANIRPFYISQYEVSFEQFDAFTKAVGKQSRHDLDWGRGARPVVDVSWFDAKEYAQWLSTVTGDSYRLPTEREWEYAAKGDAGLNQFSWGDEVGSNNANCRDCGSQWDGQSTSPVGSFAPNSLGLFDTHGNVWEMTEDCYTPTYHPTFSSRSEKAKLECRSIIVRGGSWDTKSLEIKAWFRAPYLKMTTSNDVGFRLVKDIEKK